MFDDWNNDNMTNPPWRNKPDEEQQKDLSAWNEFLIFVMVLCICFFVAGVLVMDAKAESDSKKMGLEDQYHLRAVNAELNLIQEQINKLADQTGAKDKVKEREEIITRVCRTAGIKVEQCVVDPEKGTVQQKQEAPTGPPASAPVAPTSPTPETTTNTKKGGEKK